MSLIIIGTVGCHHTGDEGWMAYLPIKLKTDDLFLTLAETEIARQDYCHFYLRGGEDWENIARCDFPEDHQYMHVYRELLRALETAMATGVACESEKLDVPLTPADSGFVPVPENNLRRRKRKNEDFIEKYPNYLKHDLTELIKAEEEEAVTGQTCWHMDCLLDELYNSIGAAYREKKISKEEAKYLYKRYLGMNVSLEDV